MIEAIVNVNTVLIILAVGTIIWVLRQILPDYIENHKVWKVVLRVLPVALGAAVAMIPQLRPMGDIVQSAVLGAVAGSFSSTLYGFIRAAMGEKIKLLLGSKATRKANGEENGEEK